MSMWMALTFFHMFLMPSLRMSASKTRPLGNEAGLVLSLSANMARTLAVLRAVFTVSKRGAEELPVLDCLVLASSEQV
jgi:hypothetical protein